jgi:hypothetical protein
MATSSILYKIGRVFCLIFATLPIKGASAYRHGGKNQSSAIMKLEKGRTTKPDFCPVSILMGPIKGSRYQYRNRTTFVPLGAITL